MLLVLARNLSFSLTFAIAFLLTGLSGSGAYESIGKSSPFALASNPIDSEEELAPIAGSLEDAIGRLWCCSTGLLMVKEVSTGTGGGGGAAAYQAAVRSIDNAIFEATFSKCREGEQWEMVYRETITSK